MKVKLDVLYNNAPFSGQVGAAIESLTYTDSAGDESDALDITLDAGEDKWLYDWMPEQGATLRARIDGYNWDFIHDDHVMECGLFVLDEVQYSDTPAVLQVRGVSKPADTDFSECEREDIWTNTSVRRIGETIAARYGLAFSFDAQDYDIDCAEQDAADGSFYSGLCRQYGLVMKVYAKRLWVYDREAYKEKPEAAVFGKTKILRGSLVWSTSLAGVYTGGEFTYSDPDLDRDIECRVGGGKKTLQVNRRATSVYDASVQLAAALNGENHGAVTLRFSTDGCWNVCAGNNIRITGYGGLDGRYFVDSAKHTVNRAGGFVTEFSCSRVTAGFRASDVSGAASGGEEAGGAAPGTAVTLSNAPFYYTSTAKSPGCHKSGTYYFYDGECVAGRYRMTNSAARCGKLPVGKNVTGWVPESYVR